MIRQAAAPAGIDDATLATLLEGETPEEVGYVMKGYVMQAYVMQNYVLQNLAAYSQL